MVKIAFGWYMTPEFQLRRIDRPTELAQRPWWKPVKTVSVSSRKLLEGIAKLPSKRLRLRALGKLAGELRRKIRYERYNSVVNRYAGENHVSEGVGEGKDNNSALLAEVDRLRGIKPRSKNRGDGN